VVACGLRQHRSGRSTHTSVRGEGEHRGCERWCHVMLGVVEMVV